MQLHLEIAQTLMDFLSLDFIGQLKTTTTGNQSAWTVICMLTNYIMCISIPDKSTDTVVNAYLKEVYYRFGGS